MYGYLGARRDVSKNLSFAMIRSPDQDYCIQIISSSKDIEGRSLDSHRVLRSLKEWTPVKIIGTFKERQPAKDDTVLGMRLINHLEIDLQFIVPLNEIPIDLVIKEDTVFSSAQRHLQLRTERALRENLRQRSIAKQAAIKQLTHNKFIEIETPVLFKSTPEGAREFLVPTRNKGFAYALPQSPQQYKQILMASGIEKYFQFARCFRDEDLRADRQPEFTQLDLEMSFAGERDVKKCIEGVVKAVWNDVANIQLHPGSEFPEMTYQEAMASYGSDKPDLRLEAKIHNITTSLPEDLIKKITPLQSPAIDAFKMHIGISARETRKFISNFLDSPEGKPFLLNPDGQPAVFVGDTAQPLSGLSALGHEYAMAPPEELVVEDGDLLILQARKNEPFFGGSTTLGNLRLALHKAAVAQGIVSSVEKNKGFNFVWIVDFPLFSPTNDTDPGQGGTAGLSSTHHPFTAPKLASDAKLLLTAPEKVIAAHFDLVVNGVELGGGSRRIHNAEIQEFIFRDVLKMRNERIEDFRHLLDVLRSGCPPHAGFAIGWDRLMTVLLGKDSVRDVIAFPKSGKGEDPLVKSPTVMTQSQLDTYHLRLTE
ncbi:aspartyl-tRNA synthetase [Pleomassaria siparia CBS 279.74]|uniref:Aspartyl-tRNA synthetase n=1 Tax=Pleomassaria siparia CBS 279.74 TaxID=1314801 RepID=A0A6G1KAU0_9PLEO|nr:aspartyl-tRNA synthetase [Pleomassaria siparia CBS 279.74]